MSNLKALALFQSIHSYLDEMIALSRIFLGMQTLFSRNNSLTAFMLKPDMDMPIH